MKKIIYLILPFFFLCCKKEISNYETQFRYHGEGTSFEVIIPMYYEKDSFLCCYEISSIYYSLNMRIVDENVFCQLLYEKNKNNEYLELNKEGYEQFKSSEVKVIPEMKKIYEEEGIDGVLKRYDPNYLVNHSLPEFSYFVYLCWINDKYVYSGDEVYFYSVE